MISEKDIVFVTTTLCTKWLYYQSNIIKKLFPETNQIVVNGQNNWPNSWFYWIKEIKNSNCKYYIHIDEDFFITSKKELMKAIQKMEDNDIDIMGCSDGYNEYRGANPVAINTFMMMGKVEHLSKLNFDQIEFEYNKDGWVNNYELMFKESYKNDFNYTFKQTGGSNFKFQQEPYYAFLWTMKEMGCKFDYLYPYFDNRFKSTNPRLDENSDDIGIHMWYTR